MNDFNFLLVLNFLLKILNGFDTIKNLSILIKDKVAKLANPNTPPVNP